MQKNTITERVKSALRQIDNECEIVLFGSQARGTATTESDWDFLFLTQKSITPELWEAIASAVLAIELERDIVVQVIPKNKKDWESRHVVTPLYRNVQREGVRL